MPTLERLRSFTFLYAQNLRCLNVYSWRQHGTCIFAQRFVPSLSVDAMNFVLSRHLFCAWKPLLFLSRRSIFYGYTEAHVVSGSFSSVCKSMLVSFTGRLHPQGRAPLHINEAS